MFDVKDATYSETWYVSQIRSLTLLIPILLIFFLQNRNFKQNQEISDTSDTSDFNSTLHDITPIVENSQVNISES
jgi:hypothetical protein